MQIEPNFINLTGKENKFKTFHDILASFSNSCYISNRNRILTCWGSPETEIIKIPKKATKDITYVSLGEGHACAITSSNATLVCWGLNSSGQCDIPREFSQSADVGTGLGFTCAISLSDIFFCWGLKGYIKDGVEYYITANVPDIAYMESHEFKVGAYHVCSAYYDKLDEWMKKHKDYDPDSKEPPGKLFSRIICWGANDSGQTDLPEKLTTALITHELNVFDAGYRHNCAIVETKLFCWGLDSFSQSSPPMNGGFRRILYVWVFPAWYHTCGLIINGSVECWGNNEYGQTEVPYINEVPLSWSSGGVHNCFQTNNFKVSCFGSNENHQCDVPKFGVY